MHCFLKKINQKEQNAKSYCRGFNYIDYNGNKRYERISFVGHHYVECYIVKNNIVVNKDRFLVNLID